MDDYKYLVPVRMLEHAKRLPKEVTQSVKGAVGRKMLSRMKKEVVDCPVLGVERPFLVCFSCSNFVRRVSGKVYCRGLPLE